MNAKADLASSARMNVQLMLDRHAAIAAMLAEAPRG
jgi:hypothetical protein